MSQRFRGKTRSPVEALATAHRLRLLELLPWVIAIAAYFVYDDRLATGSQILVMILFALSLDLILGYAGIVTLGHAAFFGLGAYTAAILADHGWGEPITGLIAGAAVAGVVGFLSGLVILRAHGLTLIMLTLMIGLGLHEAANRLGWLTGGANGLSDVTIWPIFGRFQFDQLYGRTGYLYTLAVLFVCWLFARRLVHSPFGRTLTGIRENVTRMHAIGAPVRRRQVTVYTIAAALAGIAGALLAQTTQSVALTVMDFPRSGGILIMLVLGGVGRLYGAFVGAPVYMLVQDQLSELAPVYWNFWVGLMLVCVVMFARGGLLGIVDMLVQLVRRMFRR
jgi:branched-chain amino acid transport system permease protein